MAQASPAVPATPWTATRVALATLTVLAVVFCFWFVYRFNAILFTLFVAIFLSIAMRPAVDLLRRLGLPRSLGVLVVYLLLLAGVLGLFWVIGPLVADQAATIAGKLPDYYLSFRNSLFGSHSILIRRLVEQLPGRLFESGAPAAPAAAANLDALSQAMGIASGVGQALFTLAGIFILAFAWTMEGERHLRSLLLRVPIERREEAAQLITDMESKLGAYLRGQVILSLSVGAGVAISCLIVGIPYALTMGVIGAVFESVPVLGAIMASGMPILLALSLAPDKVVWIVIAMVIVQEAEAHILAPRIMNRTVGVHPIVTILALTAFTSLFGIVGALLAVPIAAVIQLLLDRFVLSGAGGETQAPEGRDELSVLRVEAQDLVQDVHKQVRRKDQELDDVADQVEDMIEALALDLDSALAEEQAPQEVK